VFWAQFAWVQSTNFWGSDEWLHLSLTSRGIIDFPYANRPLMLLWSLPAALLVPKLWSTSTRAEPLGMSGEDWTCLYPASFGPEGVRCVRPVA
jgi:hypothetical protein